MLYSRSERLNADRSARLSQHPAIAALYFGVVECRED
jgi:hypothetical protein